MFRFILKEFKYLFRSNKLLILIITALIVLILFIMSLFIRIHVYNPWSLLTINYTNGIKILEIYKIWPAIVISISSMIISIIFSIVIFNKKQI